MSVLGPWVTGKEEIQKMKKKVDGTGWGTGWATRLRKSGKKRRIEGLLG